MVRRYNDDEESVSQERTSGNRENTTLDSRFSTLHSRPFSVTLLAFGVLIIAGINLYRCVQALLQWRFLAELLPTLPLYQVLSGIVWGLAGIPMAWGLWRGARWSARLMPYASVTYTIYVWIDRLLLRRGLEGYDLPFAIGTTVILLAFILLTLSRPKVKSFFREN